MRQTHDKRKPFRGKQRHKDLREFKNQEIKRSLVHRARLRKNYFKLLVKEGVDAQELSPKEEAASGSEEEEVDENDKEAGEGGEVERVLGAVRRADPLPDQKTAGKLAKQEQRKRPVNLQERARLARERQEERRRQELEKVREKRALIEQSRRDREKKKRSLSQRTKRGQPVMGPRINALLDKIRKTS